MQLMDTADNSTAIEIPDNQSLQGNNASDALLQQIMAKCTRYGTSYSYTSPRDGEF